MQPALRKFVLGVAAVVFGAAMYSASAQKGDPWIGTWKINMEKSKFSPGPAPQSGTVTVVPAGKGVKWTSHQVRADGSTLDLEATYNFDGKDYPVKSPFANTISVKRVSNLISEQTWKKDGKVVQTFRAVMAKDGKTITTTAKGTTPKGEPMNNIAVLEKQ